MPRGPERPPSRSPIAPAAPCAPACSLSPVPVQTSGGSSSGEGSSGRWPPDGTTTVDVTVAVPADVAAGSSSFSLGTALEETPDKVVSGPTVAFDSPRAGEAQVPVVDRHRRRRRPPRAGRRRHPDLVAHPARRPRADEFAESESDPDQRCVPVGRLLRRHLLEERRPGRRRETDIQVDDADLSGAIPADRATMVFGLMQGVAIVEAATSERAAASSSRSSVQIAQDADGVLVCVFTSDEHWECSSSVRRSRTRRARSASRSGTDDCHRVVLSGATRPVVRCAPCRALRVSVRSVPPPAGPLPSPCRARRS